MRAGITRVSLNTKRSAGVKKPREIAKLQVPPGTRAAVERQQPAGGARRGGPLGNEFRGQIEVKVRALHVLEPYYQVRQSHILRGLACPDGGTGRRAGLKIRWW